MGDGHHGSFCDVLVFYQDTLDLKKQELGRNRSRMKWETTPPEQWT